MSTPDVSTAVDAALVILSRLAGGPVEVGAAAVRWAANRLDFTTCEPGRVELTFAVSEDEVIHVQDATASAALHLLTTVLRTQARVDAVNARLRATTCVPYVGPVRRGRR